MWEVETKEIEYCLWVILLNNHELLFRKTEYGNNFTLGLMCLCMRFPEVKNSKGLKILGFSIHETINSETFCQCSAENSSTFYCLQPRVHEHFTLYKLWVRGEGSYYQITHKGSPQGGRQIPELLKYNMGIQIRIVSEKPNSNFF